MTWPVVVLILGAAATFAAWLIAYGYLHHLESRREDAKTASEPVTAEAFERITELEGKVRVLDTHTDGLGIHIDQLHKDVGTLKSVLSLKNLSGK